MKKKMMKVEIINEYFKRIPKNLGSKEINLLIKEVIKKLNIKGLEKKQINIKYISTEEMKNLNTLYLKKAKSTNVLAFKNEIFLQGQTYQLLGEIALCISVIEKEAKNYQKKFETRFKHMLLHGLLHLLGFDHKSKKDQKEMEAIEDEIISELLGEAPY